MDRRRFAVIAAGGAVLASFSTRARADVAVPTAAAPNDTPSASAVEPGAVAALGRMGAYLRSLAAVEVRLVAQLDDVDAYGQVLTFDGEILYKVRSPDAFSIESSQQGKARICIYDGKSVTVWDPNTGYYGRFEAPPTIRQALDVAEGKYSIIAPLDELFYWGQDTAKAKTLISAHYVGPARVAGQDVEQYAFRGPHTDWQIWIAKGDKPLPLRVAIVRREDSARPQFRADLAWNTAPQFTADTFVSTPPPSPNGSRRGAQFGNHPMAHPSPGWFLTP